MLNKETYKRKILKRLFDIFFSTVGLIVLSPIFLIVSILIKIDSKGPVFFKQKRVGQYENIFNIFKFRTMVHNAENIGSQITIGKDSRITKIGKILREYKLDELPQLINVFIGNMSFVGPRPEVLKYVSFYTEKEKEIFEIKPGITDLASIKYSDENFVLGAIDNPEEYYKNVIMKDKLKLNFEYINKMSIFYDFKLIFKTIFKCLR